MITFTIWILLAVSGEGTSARGIVTPVAKFMTKADCAAAMERLIPDMKRWTTWQCLEVQGG
jgi:hypothetical protein